MVLLSLTGVSLLPVLAALLSAAMHQWTEFGDYALIDMRVRDVFSSDVPLVGTYSRYGWNHPGPLMYWLMAPVARVLGGSSRATIASHALFQGVAVIWLVRLAWVKGALGPVC